MKRSRAVMLRQLERIGVNEAFACSKCGRLFDDENAHEIHCQTVHRKNGSVLRVVLIFIPGRTDWIEI